MRCAVLPIKTYPDGRDRNVFKRPVKNSSHPSSLSSAYSTLTNPNNTTERESLKLNKDPHTFQEHTSLYQQCQDVYSIMSHFRIPPFRVKQIVLGFSGFLSFIGNIMNNKYN